MNKFCSNCGNPIKPGDRFCKNCGKPVNISYRHTHIPHESVNTSHMYHEKEPFNKLMQELAYTGTLFWLPIVICPEEKNARYHANQGLWILIISVIACTGIRILSALNQLANLDLRFVICTSTVLSPLSLSKPENSSIS